VEPGSVARASVSHILATELGARLGHPATDLAEVLVGTMGMAVELGDGAIAEIGTLRVRTAIATTVSVIVFESHDGLLWFEGGSRPLLGRELIKYDRCSSVIVCNNASVICLNTPTPIATMG
jgi:hypothetical protein